MDARKIIALVSFVIIAGFGFYSLDYQDLTFSNNLWQYIMTIIALIGCIGVFLVDKIDSSLRRKTIVVIWFLSILFFLFIVISSIITKDYDWKFWLLGVLVLSSATINYFESRTTNT